MSTVLPSLASYALPFGILTGVLVSMGRLSSSNEILAMESAGISLYGIALPIFTLAALATVASCVINLYYAPNSISAYRASFKRILSSDPMRFIRAHEFVNWFPGYVIYVDSIVAGKLSGFKIWQLSQSGTVDAHIGAESGTISYDGKTNSMALTLKNGGAEHFDQKNLEGEEKFSKVIFFDELSIALPIAGLVGKHSFPEKKLHHMNIGELLQARKHWRSNKAAPLTSASIKHDRRLVDMHISSNVAMSFAALAMSLVAIPLGIQVRRADASINAALALILALGYYFSMVVLSWFGDETNWHPEILVWLPNCVLTTLGIKMLRRCARH
jgi:lipopolysaccharide export system permease protein